MSAPAPVLDAAGFHRQLMEDALVEVFGEMGVITRALEEQGITWDLVGGTSIGAVMGAYAAMDRPVATITGQLRAAFARKPTGDISPLPMMALLRDGDLLVDGGNSNNYPVEVVRAAGAARVIGVDLSRDAYRPLAHAEPPSAWALFVGRYLPPRAKRRYADLPSLGAIVVNVAMMASNSHQKRMRERVDLGLQPDVSGVGLLDWTAFERVVAIGHAHARERLEAAPELTRPDRPAP
jgi:NTE family protein